jgi:hypothetical protein
VRLSGEIDMSRPRGVVARVMMRFDLASILPRLEPRAANALAERVVDAVNLGKERDPCIAS